MKTGLRIAVALGVIALAAVLLLRMGARPRCADDPPFELKGTVFDCGAGKR